MRDFDRPLSKRGQRDAPRMGEWMQQQGYRPQRVICSPAVRTRQTVMHVVMSVDYPESDIIYEPMIYEAGLRDLLTALDRYSDDADTVLLIGHNPGLDELVNYLADRAPPRSASGKLMTTAAIAVLYIHQPKWRFEKSCAELVEIMRPRTLEAH